MTKPSNNKVVDDVDKAKANVIIKWLIEIEEENNRTKKLTDKAMIQRIGKRIQDDARCL